MLEGEILFIFSLMVLCVIPYLGSWLMPSQVWSEHADWFYFGDPDVEQIKHQQ